jgi:hypothetical protein
MGEAAGAAAAMGREGFWQAAVSGKRTKQMTAITAKEGIRIGGIMGKNRLDIF